MTTMTQPPAMAPPNPPPPPPAARFDNGQEWMASLGDVPLSRVVFDPWPGTATEADLLRYCEVDKRLCELVDGTLVEKPMGAAEALLATRLSTALTVHVEARGLGIVLGADATLRMAAGGVRLPDVTFIRTADLPGGALPPDVSISTLRLTLAVEVLSPSNTAAEMRRKTREYFASGAELVWRIDPRVRTAAVFDRPSDEPTRVLTEADSLDGGAVLPGFTVALSYLFRGPARPPSDQG